jgi:predicted XRE-type DNA-binding protein
VRSERSSGNVFVDLGFEPAEAAVMQMRAILAIEIERRIRAKHWSSQEAARRLLISERQLREMLADTGAGMRLDLLVTLAVRTGLRLDFKVQGYLKAT